MIMLDFFSWANFKAVYRPIPMHPPVIKILESELMVELFFLKAQMT